MLRKFKKFTPYILCFLISFVCLISASVITSFAYSSVCLSAFYNDQAMFYILGTNMAKGYIPYVDIFDHKGLYLFYYTAIGAILGKFGVFLIQLIILTCVSIVIYKTIALFTIDKLVMISATLFYSFLFAVFGQTPGDADLEAPFIALLIYFYCKGIKNNDFKSLLIGNIFVGISTGIAINLRMSDAIVPFAFVIFFAYLAIKNKKIKEIFINAGIVLGMIIVMSIPPFLHAYLGGFFGEFINATFVSNFKYIFTTESRSDGYKWIIRAVIVLIFAVYFILYLLKRKEIDKEERMFILITLSIILGLEFIIAFYPHYLIVTLSYLAIILFRLISLYNFKINKSKLLIITTSILFGVSLLINPIIFWSSKEISINTIEYINQNVTSEDKDGKILVFGAPAIYLSNDIKIGYKDFSCQYNHQMVNENVSINVLGDYLRSEDCHYIITAKSSDSFAINLIKDLSINYEYIEKNKEVSVRLYKHIF